ncbi:ankyrin repeat-containing domain-containing protein [Artemisia annua]|uniref:Ankyrin repeat-containing domain-containing protein n=1 Tax=Artemisia annua TaxID=35608 RepID=A0A2U1LH48_ARTAN|nr:ankyrin repeat-containing domain-containing protein [Artemisia annua]
MDEKDLELQNKNYNTALSLAAAAGNVKTAMTMVKKNKIVLELPCNNNTMPLYMAALFARSEMVRFKHCTTTIVVGHCRRLRRPPLSPSSWTATVVAHYRVAPPPPLCTTTAAHHRRCTPPLLALLAIEGLFFSISLWIWRKRNNQKSGRPLHYKGSFFHFIIKGSMTQMINLPANALGLGPCS